MRAVKGKGTGPEKTVGDWLKSARFKAREHDPLLPGSPDFVLPGRKVAIFVHGCFWHQHRCKRGARCPKSNAAYWRPKLQANARRDRLARAKLRRLGWTVITVWECALGRATTRDRLIGRIRAA